MSFSPLSLSQDCHIRQTYTFLNGMDIYDAVAKGEDYIFLDSSKEDSPYSQYSIIGANPFLTVKYEGGQIYTKNFPSKDYELLNQSDIFEFLKGLTHQYQLPNSTNLPFIGGGLGYFGYDLSCELESTLTFSKKDIHIPDCYFVFYDNVLVLDLQNQILTITGLGILDKSERSVQTLYDLICSYQPKLNNNNSYNKANEPLEFISPFTKESYMEAVDTMRLYMEEGHIYIANMTHTFQTDFNMDPLKTYRLLRSINPAPFSAYMPLDGFQVLSSSPERFLDIQKGKVQTRPIKGTIPRGKTTQEDIINQRLLLDSEKDKSELLMIVDLERNDLSRVCIPGTVKVTELFKIESYATVFHLVSTIEGILAEDKSSIDCLKAAFPGGSITGAPKIRAMEIIEELEKTNRNIYTGSIGYLGFDGNVDFNIVIRTVLLQDQKAYIGVGGGITWESDPESEYQETLDKANALFKTLNQISASS